MRCEFSEMQFCIGLLRELLTSNLSPAKGYLAPVLPTQRDEALLGYDLKVAGPVTVVYFQFKVPQKMVRSYSKYWSTYGRPYFEFEVYPASITEQHNRLKDLAGTPGNCVFYCSPCFNRLDEYDYYYVNELIARNTIYISLKNLPRNSGSDKHCITYTDYPHKKCNWHSVENEVSAYDYAEFIDSVSSTKPYDNLEECIRSLVEFLSINIDYNAGMANKLGIIANHLMRNYNTMMVLRCENAEGVNEQQ